MASNPGQQRAAATPKLDRQREKAGTEALKTWSDSLENPPRNKVVSVHGSQSSTTEFWLNKKVRT